MNIKYSLPLLIVLWFLLNSHNIGYTTRNNTKSSWKVAELLTNKPRKKCFVSCLSKVLFLSFGNYKLAKKCHIIYGQLEDVFSITIL